VYILQPPVNIFQYEPERISKAYTTLKEKMYYYLLAFRDLHVGLQNLNFIFDILDLIAIQMDV